MTEGLTLLLLSSRVPYRRAKVSFEPNGAQSFGVAHVVADELEDGALEQLLADPHIIVMATLDQHLMWRVNGPEDLLVDQLMTVQQPDPGPEPEPEPDLAAAPEISPPPSEGADEIAPAAGEPQAVTAPSELAPQKKPPETKPPARSGRKK